MSHDGRFATSNLLGVAWIGYHDNHDRNITRAEGSKARVNAEALLFPCPGPEDFDVRFRPDPINKAGRIREGDQK